MEKHERNRLDALQNIKSSETNKLRTVVDDECCPLHFPFSCGKKSEMPIVLIPTTTMRWILHWSWPISLISIEIKQLLDIWQKIDIWKKEEIWKFI